jgi:hypothetical protein
MKQPRTLFTQAQQYAHILTILARPSVPVKALGMPPRSRSRISEPSTWLESDQRPLHVAGVGSATPPILILSYPILILSHPDLRVWQRTEATPGGAEVRSLLHGVRQAEKHIKFEPAPQPADVRLFERSSLSGTAGRKAHEPELAP